MNRPWRVLVCQIALLALASCTTTEATSAGGKLSKATIVSGERERDYLLYTPEPDGERRALPLVIVFHGGGGTARGIAREVGKSLHHIADSEGFFVVYPDAVDKIWDFGSGLISESLDERIDDRTYFGDLLDRLSATLPVDEHRVFATGISRGGQASYFVACSYPGRIRAIAPVAMPMPEFMRPLCEQAKGIGVVLMNGTEDPLVPYDGGQITVGRRERGEVMSSAATIDFWRGQNGCASEPAVTETLDTAKDRMQVQRTRWAACELAPVVLYRIEGGGHTWPSGRQYLPRFLVGRVNRDIDGAAEAWSFFSEFP
jgi:polyhydroxybutyrate depolymerase